MTKTISLPQINEKQVANEIGNFILNEIVPIGMTGGVIGLSGGVDSTSTAALTQRAFDLYNTRYRESDNPELELVGYMLHSDINNSADLEDGIKVAKRLGIRYEVHSIEPHMDASRLTNPEAFENDYDKGNLMSRERAKILSTKAATEKKLVIGTGNHDEDFVIGYYTLFGDGAVHLSPIGNLSKRLVRQMARYLGFKDLADRVPTAGLEPGQTDFKDLGYEYDLVELVGEGIRQEFTNVALICDTQIQELAQRDIKNYEKIFKTQKHNSVDDIVHDILWRNQIANGKARIIHPPAAEVTLEYKLKGGLKK